jgi:hypothetical protein
MRSPDLFRFLFIFLLAHSVYALGADPAPASSAADPGAGRGSEIIVNLDVTLPRGSLLGPSSAGEAVVSILRPGASVETLPPMDLGNSKPSAWNADRKAYEVAALLQGVNVPPGARVSVTLRVPVIVPTGEKLKLLEVVSASVPGPEEESGVVYVTGKPVKVVEIPETAWQNADGNRYAKMKRYFYLIYELPDEKTKLALPSDRRCPVKVFKGKGSDEEKLELVAQIYGTFIKGASSDPALMLLAAPVPPVPDGDPSDFQAKVSFEMKRGEEVLEVDAHATFRRGSAGSSKFSLEGVVAELKGRPKAKRGRD